MPDPFYKGPDDPRRHRRVAELAPRTDRQDEAAPESETEEVFDDLARVANIAQVLVDATDRLASQFSIPVTSSAEQVRGAVRRKDQNVPDGSRITFDLFKDAFQTLERRRNAVRLEGLENLTGNALADDQSIRLMMGRADHRDLGEGQLLMMVSGLMVLSTLNHMLAPYQSVDTQQAVVAKTPPGTEGPPLVTQTIIGITYQLLIAGLEESLVEDFLRRSGVESSLGVQIPDIISRARSREPDELQDLAGRAIGEGDYELILDYAYDFLNKTHKPGYESWIAYGDARRIRMDAATRFRSAPFYSRKHALRVSGAEPGNLDSTDALRQAVLDALVPAEVGYVCSLRDHVTRLDSTLNTVGQVMASRFGQDTLCCLGRFLADQDLKWVRNVRVLLSIFMGTQSANRELDFKQLLSGLLNFLDYRVRQELIDLIHQVVYRIGDPVLERLDTRYDNDDWNALYQCPLIHDLVEVLLDALDGIGTYLVGVIDGISVEAEVQYGEPVRNRWMVIHTRRRVQSLLGVLDQVVDALDAGLLCSGPDNVFDEEAFRDFVDGLPGSPVITLDPGDVQRYFSDSGPIEVPGSLQGTIGGTIPPIDDPLIRPTVNSEMNETEELRRCRELFENVLSEGRA